MSGPNALYKNMKSGLVDGAANEACSSALLLSLKTAAQKSPVWSNMLHAEVGVPEGR